MSIFDPQSLYIHHQKSTKKGQIIQKKPQPKLSAIKKEEIPRSISVLSTYGYIVTPPGGNPPSPEPLNLTNSKSQSITLTTNPNASVLNLKFNSVWDIVKEDFEDILSIPLEKITDASLEISIFSLGFNIIGSQADTITYDSDCITDSTFISTNSRIVYQTYSDTKAIKTYCDNSGYTTNQVNSTSPFELGGYTTYQWDQIVNFGQLTNDVTLFQIYRNTLQKIGEVNVSIYVNAIVNYQY